MAVVTEKVSQKVLTTLDTTYSLLLTRVFQNCTITVNAGRDADVDNIVQELNARIAAAGLIFSPSKSETIIRDRLLAALPPEAALQETPSASDADSNDDDIDDDNSKPSGKNPKTPTGNPTKGPKGSTASSKSSKATKASKE